MLDAFKQLAFLIGFACLALHQPATAQPATDAHSWTPAWTASMLEASAEDSVVTLDNATLRSEVRLSVGGHEIRLRLSNEFGSYLPLGAVTVRNADGAFVPVTFGGQASVTLPDHGPLVSDPVALEVAPFERIEISIFIAGEAELSTLHFAPGQPTLVSPPGNFSMVGFDPVATHKSRPLIAGVDVASNGARPVIVALGDSITDNTGCANDAVPICRWSDVLARRISEAGLPHAVVTQAISGNRLIAKGTGPSALNRLDRDVFSLPGVTHIILLEGINDIGNSGRTRNEVTQPEITADQLIEGYRQIIQRAHEHGIRVIGMTILPFEGASYYTESGEAMREEVNRWIRESQAFDSVIDLEKTLAAPTNPRRLADRFQRGDNLHANAEGQVELGEVIPLDLFR